MGLPAVSTKKTETHVYRQVELRSLPSFWRLNERVQEVLRHSTWWDRYGVDWLHVAVAVLWLLPGGLLLLRSGNLPTQAAGVFLLGCYHAILSNKAGHVLIHNGMSESPRLNWLCSRLFVDFVGGFSTQLGWDMHVKMHHPHTNIIGLGDSSVWRVPSLPRSVYMFLAPLCFPIITPVVSVGYIIQNKLWRELPVAVSLVCAGAAFHVYLLVAVSGFSLGGALLLLPVYRAVLSIPYIHINIFQHIGLPMYSPEDRPVRIYQMSTGVLNLSRNAFLDATFGHALINCHVEHHLFPKLSDNMCLKIKPLVRDFLLDNGLPYNEDSYWRRLKLFLKNYTKLMVDAPPITHFVGIQ